MRLLILSVILISFLNSSAQNLDSIRVRNNYTKLEVYIPMRDGVKLFTSIYIPKDSTEQHPFLMTRTPYSCFPYGEDQFGILYPNHYKEYIKENYIIVTQDVRGRWMSEGSFVDIRPFNPQKTNQDTDKASDTYDTIDWLLKNIKNNNGKVGVFGISYPGFYSTMASLSKHPALVAVSPQAPVTEWFIGDDWHHNGAFLAMDAFAFYTGFGKPRPKPTTTGPEGFKYFTKDIYEFYLRTGAISNLTKLMGDTISFWKDLMGHPNYDDWWKAHNSRNFAQEIPANCHTLFVGGLFDAEDCFGAWSAYKATEKKASNKNTLVMGPWYHGQWASGDGSHLGNVQFGSNTTVWYAQHIEIPFFNYYLKGKGSIDNIAEANIFITGENTWKQFDQWPPKNVQYTDFYFHQDEKLSMQKPLATGRYTTYISDPAKPVPYTEGIHERRTREYMTDDQRFAAIRPDVLVFKTDILDQDITLSGPVTADLMVSISTTDADFVVKLIDVFSDDFAYDMTPSEKTEINSYIMNGYQMLIRGEIFRGRYRNSFEKPVAFVPGKITKIKYDLPDVAHTFKKGHRIMVQVQSTWFPLADRNPQQFKDIYHAADKDFIKSTIRLHHAALSPSKIVLPVLK